MGSDGKTVADPSGYRKRAVQGDKKLERNPVTVHMNVMLETWRKAGDRGTMLWAAACTFFFRVSESRRGSGPGGHGLRSKGSSVLRRCVGGQPGETSGDQSSDQRVQDGQVQEGCHSGTVLDWWMHVPGEGGTSVYGGEEGRPRAVLQVAGWETIDQKKLRC